MNSSAKYLPLVPTTPDQLIGVVASSMTAFKYLMRELHYEYDVPKSVLDKQFKYLAQSHDARGRKFEKVILYGDYWRARESTYTIHVLEDRNVEMVEFQD